jgi:non-reducing end alpha-L-arabinofuranosidase
MLLRKVQFLPISLILAMFVGLIAPPNERMLIGMPVAHAEAAPCDIYASGGTPCVAAHSTTRALFAAYNGPLYQIRRTSDDATLNIGVLTTGGFANAAAQDSFCVHTTCVITIIFDQTSRHNDLQIEPAGAAGPANRGVPAEALPVTAGGQIVYGESFSGQMGYRHTSGSGVAVNGQPEGMYMVTSGTHSNSLCCFDYGNVEKKEIDNGSGHMDAINFGTACGFSCTGAGPWIGADLENGIFFGSQNTANIGNPNPYVTAMLKNDGQNFALKDGNARSGGLVTRYSGALPAGYTMHQEGSIVLGTGGDNSNRSHGSFFEGAMTAGLPSDETENKVQANIVTVNYGGPSPVAGELTSSPPSDTINALLYPGSTISLRATTVLPGGTCCTMRYISHENTSVLSHGGNVVTSVINSTSSQLDKDDGTFILRRGLADNTCGGVSFESRNYPGDFLRHFENSTLFLQPDNGTTQFRSDATFCPQPGKSGQIGTTSFASLNVPDHFIRHWNGTLYIAKDGGPHSNPWDTTLLWPDDVSWVVSLPWTP